MNKRAPIFGALRLSGSARGSGDSEPLWERKREAPGSRCPVCERGRVKQTGPSRSPDPSPGWSAGNSLRLDGFAGWPPWMLGLAEHPLRDVDAGLDEPAVTQPEWLVHLPFRFIRVRP